MSEIKCECPARKALEEIRSDVPCSTTLGDGDEIPLHVVTLAAFQALQSIAKAALSAPCACEEAGQQLEFDRTTLAAVVTGLRKAFDSRFWLTEGRGSYEWDDDRYREEFREAYQEISKAVEPLKKLAADWSGCPRKAADVAKARIDLKEKNKELLIIARDAAVRIGELRRLLGDAEADRNQLRAALVRKIHDYSELWQECNELRAQVKNTTQRNRKDHK